MSLSSICKAIFLHISKNQYLVGPKADFFSFDFGPFDAAIVFNLSYEFLFKSTLGRRDSKKQIHLSKRTCNLRSLVVGVIQKLPR